MNTTKHVSKYIKKPSLLHGILLFGAAVLVGLTAAHANTTNQETPTPETEDIEAEDVTNNPLYNKTKTNV